MQLGAPASWITRLVFVKVTVLLPVALFPFNETKMERVPLGIFAPEESVSLPATALSAFVSVTEEITLPISGPLQNLIVAVGTSFSAPAKPSSVTLLTVEKSISSPPKSTDFEIS